MRLLVDESYKIFINLFGKFPIYKYAVCILLGGFVVLWICQHLAKKDGYPKNIIFDAFLIVFPMGILGARLYYCLANLREFSSFWEIFNIRDGGLAVQGGVALGCLSGLWFFHRNYPKDNLRYWADLIVPNILIAQAIGRWGNFFNGEVYGACQPVKNWNWLPGFIVEQQETLCTAQGQMAVPLFLIECIINLIGFILISYILRKFWHKGRQLGDLCAFYFIWYGVVRLILEPMRNTDFIMKIKEGGLPSTMVFSGLMVIFGIGMLIFNRIVKPKVVFDYEYEDVLDKVKDNVDA